MDQTFLCWMSAMNVRRFWLDSEFWFGFGAVLFDILAEYFIWICIYSFSCCDPLNGCFFFLFNEVDTGKGPTGMRCACFVRVHLCSCLLLPIQSDLCLWIYSWVACWLRCWCLCCRLIGVSLVQRLLRWLWWTMHPADVQWSRCISAVPSILDGLQLAVNIVCKDLELCSFAGWVGFGYYGLSSFLISVMGRTLLVFYWLICY